METYGGNITLHKTWVKRQLALHIQFSCNTSLLCSVCVSSVSQMHIFSRFSVLYIVCTTKYAFNSIILCGMVRKVFHLAAKLSQTLWRRVTGQTEECLPMYTHEHKWKSHMYTVHTHTHTCLFYGSVEEFWWLHWNINGFLDVFHFATVVFDCVLCLFLVFAA